MANKKKVTENTPMVLWPELAYHVEGPIKLLTDEYDPNNKRLA